MYPPPRDWETDCPDFAAGAQDRIHRYSGGDTPQGGFSRPSADLPSAPALRVHPHPPQCAHWGTFPLEGGRLGGRPGVPPLRRIQKPSLLFRRAGHWPARRCTRRAESWFRPVSLALAGQFTFSRPTGCRDLHGRPHSAPTEGGRKFPKRAADSRPTKWVATCPLIRLAFARHLPPKGKAFGRPQGSPLRRIQHQYCWFGKARRRI